MQSFKVLVVDDFEPFRRFACSTLESRSEFQVVGQASDGLEAVQKAEELQPDLILLDIGLPTLNGIEAAKRIRKLAPGAKILFISQESSPEVLQEAIRLGAMGYLEKTRTQSDLLPAIETVLSGKKFVSSGLESSVSADARAPHSHEILFCSDETVLLDGLTSFIAAALNSGNAAIVWATESHRDSLLQRLQSQGVDIAAAIQRGTFISSDAAESPDLTRMLKTIAGLSEAAAKAGKEHPRIAVCGERAGRFWVEGKTDEAIRLEQLLNELAKRQDVDILCPYPMPTGHEDNVALKSIRAEHTVIYSR